MPHPKDPWFDPRVANFSFGLEFEEYSYEEDLQLFQAGELEEGSVIYDWVQRISRDPEAHPDLEQEAIREMSRFLGRPFQTQGHDSWGALVCVVHLDSWSEFLQFWERGLAALVEDGNDSLSHTPYMRLTGLRLEVAEGMEFVPAKDAGYFKLPAIEDLIDAAVPQPTIRGPRRVTRQDIYRRLAALS